MSFVKGAIDNLRCNQPVSSQHWFEHFVKYFVEHEDEDDLLFFVQEDGIQVKRRVGTEMPQIDGPMQWEETFYVNLIARLRCEVRVTVVHNTNVQRQRSGRVFAEPTKGETLAFANSFPHIYFSVADSEKVFNDIELSAGEALCVELRALLDDTADASDSSNASENNQYEAWREGESTVVLFQGAAPYEGLYGAHGKKVGMRLSTPQKVLMRGPHGRGYAQVLLTDTEAATLGSLRVGLQRALHPTSSRLRCCLAFVHVHWRLIVLDLFRHRHSITINTPG
ncbi:hypothetical protein PSACC_03434 [Paramicrosporidium saccamoebae]|uniref:Uncharacterized protein n=1 Tax=Paramicrosporidium saccamoebae TaxID=1246581 RepID=A0A2H9TG56_9FUNG|nr:hypothetical protein PSACC_03434 [Paramicrosporidium saccamoebae]